MIRGISMRKQDILPSLSKHIQQHHYLDVTIQTANEEKIQCIPIAVSKEFVLVLNYLDFIADGFYIIRIKDIVNLCYSDSCRYFETIVKKEGAMTFIQHTPPITLSSWNTVFCSLKKLDGIVIVDIGKENCVNVGKICNVLEDAVSMLCFSPTGEWDDQEWVETFDNITGVKFDNHYTNSFAKYLPK